MKQLTFGDCVKKGWISSWQAITQMPWLFVGVCAVFACTSLLSGRHPSAAADTLDAAARAAHGLISLAWFALQLAVSGTLTIKVHRFVLLGEGTHPLVPLHGKPLGRYALVWLAISLVMVPVLVTLAVTHSPVSGLLVSVPLLVIGVFLVARLSLLYPSVALGGRLTWRAAWRDSRGHVWSIVGIWLVTYLPLFAITVLLILFTGPRLVAAQRSAAEPVFAIVHAVFNGLFIAFGAASLSWLYRRYARELLPYAEDAPR